MNRSVDTIRRESKTAIRLAVALLLAVAWMNNLFAQNARSQRANLLNEVMNEQVLSTNGRAICERANRLPTAERQRMLAAWVMPNTSRKSFRLAGWFSQTHPPDYHAADAEAPSLPGGEVMSPAQELIESAKLTGSLNTLSEEIAATTPTDNHNQRSRAALLAMIEIARGNNRAAIVQLEQLYSLTDNSGELKFDQRWPETLAANAAVQVPQLHNITQDLLHLLKVQDDHRGSDVWANQILAMIGKTKAGAAKENATAGEELQHWSPVSRVDFKADGIGRPPALWNTSGGEVQNIAGHGIDFLYYQIPLRGNYEIECEVSSYSHAIGHLMTSDHWVSVTSAGKMNSGTFRANGLSSTLEPKLGKLDPWARYRIVMHENIRTLFYNGRQIDQRSVPADHDPWVAIRNVWVHNSKVRNVRVTGKPEIPNQIDMLGGESITHWMPYFQDQKAWKRVADLSTPELIGERWANVDRGVNAESLLYYNRPMLEDGVIEYDFFYKPDEIEVHPAIDRHVFLLAPDGVKTHWLTDGPFDSTGAEPRNIFDGSTDIPLSFRENEWNHMTLSLIGDELKLALNNTPVTSHRLAKGGQRSFGLFHFADQTKVRICNATYRGEWPKHLPSLSKQELAAEDHECLNNMQNLKEVFTQSFVGDVISPETFQISGKNIPDTVEVRTDGLRITPGIQTGWDAVRITKTKPIFGDFDAVLDFSGLDIKKVGKGPLGVSMFAISPQGHTVGAGRVVSSKDRHEAISKLVMVMPDGKKRYISRGLADESTDGRLRLIRRGKLFHSLIAHGDSSQFHHIGSQELKETGSPMKLELVVNSVDNGMVSVVVESLAVRSNSDAVEKLQDPRVRALEQYTTVLSSSYGRNFAKSGTDNFTAFPGTKTSADAKGLRLYPDAEDIRSRISAIGFNHGLLNDFEISAELDVSKLSPTESAAMSLALSDSGETARVVVERKDNDTLLVRGETSRGAQLERAKTLVGTSEAASVDGIRLIRIQQTLFFLFSESGTSRFLGQFDVGAAPIPQNGVVFQTTSNKTNFAQVDWKSFEARATQIVR